MHQKRLRKVSIGFSLLILAIGAAACRAPAEPAPFTPTPTSIIAQATSAPPDATFTIVPVSSNTAQVVSAANGFTATPALPTGASPTDASPKTTTGPQCTILKSANFRKGPGTAYQPPLRALPEGTLLIPQGFNPKGTPTGSWVQVVEPASNQVGWVNVDPQLITCNIDLTTLASVAVEPPPPPPAPVVSNSQIEGQFNGLKGKVIISPDYLMRMQVHGPNGSKDGDGIKRVTFTISDPYGTVYQRTENTAAYCVFGGGEPDCNPWTKVDGQYVWEKGGQPVKDGTYHVSIQVEPTGANGDASQFGNWEFSITIKLP